MQLTDITLAETKFRKAGKEAFYSLDDDHVVKLMRQGLEHVRES